MKRLVVTDCRTQSRIAKATGIRGPITVSSLSYNGLYLASPIASKRELHDLLTAGAYDNTTDKYVSAARLIFARKDFEPDELAELFRESTELVYVSLFKDIDERNVKDTVSVLTNRHRGYVLSNSWYTAVPITNDDSVDAITSKSKCSNRCYLYLDNRVVCINHYDMHINYIHRLVERKGIHLGGTVYALGDFVVDTESWPRVQVE